MELTYQLNELKQTAKQLIQNFKHKVVILNAPMGAGKTTITKEIVKVLGADNHTSSPTFSLVNSYELPNNQLFYHFDLYRLENEEEALDFGFEEYIDSGNWCFIEWAEVIKSLLPLDYHEITIEILDENTRKLTLNNHQ